jgi:hypothetical protein
MSVMGLLCVVQEMQLSLLPCTFLQTNSNYANRLQPSIVK